MHAVRVTCGDAVEPRFHIGRELVIDERAEVFLEKLHHAEREPARHEGRTFLFDVAAILDHGDRGGVCGGAANSALLEGTHERGLGVTRRGSRFVPVRRVLGSGELLALLHLGETLIFAVLLGIA